MAIITKRVYICTEKARIKKDMIRIFDDDPNVPMKQTIEYKLLGIPIYKAHLWVKKAEADSLLLPDNF